MERSGTGVVLQAIVGLFQSLLCRSHLVKGAVFLDEAGRFRGDLLEEEFRCREEVGVLRLQVPCGHPAVLGVDLHADAVAARAQGRNHRRARAAEGIEHRVAGE